MQNLGGGGIVSKQSGGATSATGFGYLEFRCKLEKLQNGLKAVSHGEGQGKSYLSA